jgi:hypothetical protein
MGQRPRDQSGAARSLWCTHPGREDRGVEVARPILKGGGNIGEILAQPTGASTAPKSSSGGAHRSARVFQTKSSNAWSIRSHRRLVAHGVGDLEGSQSGCRYLRRCEEACYRLSPVMPRAHNLVTCCFQRRSALSHAERRRASNPHPCRIALDDRLPLRSDKTASKPVRRFAGRPVSTDVDQLYFQTCDSCQRNKPEWLTPAR